MGMNDSWNTKSRFVDEVHALSFRGSPVGDVHALSFHGSPARVPLLLQAARGRNAQLQARGVDDLGPGAIQAEIPFERVDDVVERRWRGLGLANRLFYRGDGFSRQCDHQVIVDALCSHGVTGNHPATLVPVGNDHIVVHAQEDHPPRLLEALQVETHAGGVLPTSIY